VIPLTRSILSTLEVVTTMRYIQIDVYLFTLLETSLKSIEYFADW